MTGRFSLAGEVAVVTGALGRLGPIWADALLDAGATVAALDRPGTRPSPAFAELSERVEPARLHRFDADITDRSSIDAARDAIVERLGTPTVLVNNAGIDQPPDSATDRFRIEDMPVELFRRMVEVNLLGTFQMTQAFGALMVGRRRGAIINIGSLYASVSPDQRFYDHFEGQPPFLKVPSYGASKAAVVNMTKYFATLWGPFDVRVNVLSPGGVLASQDGNFKRKYADRVPLGRMAGDADLKGPLVFLASSASSYVTGHELRVDGGFTAW
jgi:NAD(P)-dependent dehydrogenase (short-subunit alcohol dehydrogenase family)